MPDLRTLPRGPRAALLALSLFSVAGFATAREASAPATEERSADPESERKAAAIARQIMSPFCPGRTVSDCTSEYAAEWRREMLELVREGKSADEIAREFEGRAGRDLSGIPNRSVGYGLPVTLAFGAGLILVGLFSWLRRDKGNAAPSPTPDGPMVDDERLRAELERLDDD